MPADFEVVAMTGGVLPWTEIKKIEIKGSGEVIYSTAEANDRVEGTFLEVSRFQINPDGLQSLYQTIVQNEFFGLKKIYDAENYVDGSFAELTITADGKRHSVHTVNFELKPFDDIFRQINQLAPENIQLIYDVLTSPPTPQEIFN